MKKEDGKLVPENANEARDLVRLWRQAANQKLDWSERTTDAEMVINLTEAAKDLLDRAEVLAEKWGIGTP